MTWFEEKRDLELQEWEARKAQPVMIEVTAEEQRDMTFALMLLRRVQGNTKDGDLLRVDARLVPIYEKIEHEFRRQPEVDKLVEKQRAVLNRMLEERGQPPLPEREP